MNSMLLNAICQKAGVRKFENYIPHHGDGDCRFSFHLQLCVGTFCHIGCSSSKRGARNSAAHKVLESCRSAVYNSSHTQIMSSPILKSFRELMNKRGLLTDSNFFSVPQEPSCPSSKSVKQIKETSARLDTEESATGKVKGNNVQKSGISFLYEFGTRRNICVEFSYSSTMGLDNRCYYTSHCKMGQFQTSGSGHTKREAKNNAADQMIIKLENAGILNQKPTFQSICNFPQSSSLDQQGPKLESPVSELKATEKAINDQNNAKMNNSDKNCSAEGVDSSNWTVPKRTDKKPTLCHGNHLETVLTSIKDQASIPNKLGRDSNSDVNGKKLSKGTKITADPDGQCDGHCEQQSEAISENNLEERTIVSKDLQVKGGADEKVGNSQGPHVYPTPVMDTKSIFQSSPNMRIFSSKEIDKAILKDSFLPSNDVNSRIKVFVIPVNTNASHKTLQEAYWRIHQLYNKEAMVENKDTGEKRKTDTEESTQESLPKKSRSLKDDTAAEKSEKSLMNANLQTNDEIMGQETNSKFDNEQKETRLTNQDILRMWVGDNTISQNRNDDASIDNVKKAHKLDSPVSEEQNQGQLDTHGEDEVCDQKEFNILSYLEDDKMDSDLFSEILNNVSKNESMMTEADMNNLENITSVHTCAKQDVLLSDPMWNQTKEESSSQTLLKYETDIPVGNSSLTETGNQTNSDICTVDGCFVSQSNISSQSASETSCSTDGHDNFQNEHSDHSYSQIKAFVLQSRPTNCCCNQTANELVSPPCYHICDMQDIYGRYGQQCTLGVTDIIDKVNPSSRIQSESMLSLLTSSADILYGDWERYARAGF